jgi:biopolymer transport protein ExbB/biopolymer transport protein TolQ
MQLSLWELWQTMSWFPKGIVYVLLFMSIYVATVAIRKSIALWRARKKTLVFQPLFSKALAEENFEQAKALVEKYPQSHLAAAFRRVFVQLAELAKDNNLTAAEVASIQRHIDLNTLEQLSRYRRGLGVLATVGSTAPFVGLLGTTMGVVNAFTGMAISGSGGLAAISAGIAEALITTAFGLLVALPAVWLYNYYINRIDYISMEVTYVTKEFIDFLLRYEAKLHAQAGGAGWRQSDTVSQVEVSRPAAVGGRQ